MNALYLCGTCGSPVFTDVQGQFGNLRRADDKSAQTGVDRVGNGYLNLQRSADTCYCISPWTDVQRVISQAIRRSSPILIALARHVPKRVLDIALRRVDFVVPLRARIVMRLRMHGQRCVNRSDGCCVSIDPVGGDVWLVARYLRTLAWQWRSNQSAINTLIARPGRNY